MKTIQIKYDKLNDNISVSFWDIETVEWDINTREVRLLTTQVSEKTFDVLNAPWDEWKRECRKILQEKDNDFIKSIN